MRGLPHPRPQRVGRLSEALIEVGTAPAAGDMDEVAVEHRPFALVLVQAEIEELAQKSAALRSAESIRVLLRPCTRLILLVSGWPANCHSAGSGAALALRRPKPWSEIELRPSFSINFGAGEYG